MSKKIKNPPNFVARKWTTKKGENKVAYYHRTNRKEAGKDTRKLTPLGTDYKAALKKWADLQGVEIEPQKSSVCEIYIKYMKWAENRTLSNLSTRTIKDRRGYWDNHLKKVFGAVQINTLKPVWMLQYFEQRSSKSAAKKEIKFLSVLCNWARLRDLMTTENPTTSIMRQLKVDEKRNLYVTDDDFKLVYKHANQLIKDAMLFTYICGNRPDETTRARFSDIEGNTLTINIKKTESSGHSKKCIPIEGELKHYIEQQRRRTIRSLYLVSDEKGQPFKPTFQKFRRAFDDARNKAEAEAKEKGINFVRFQLRDLRAKAATDTDREHGIEAARCLLGHTTQKQTADYIRHLKGQAANSVKTTLFEANQKR